MEIHIPDSYVEIDREEFWQLLDSFNYRRDAYYNGEIFEATDWQNRQVAIHTTDNRYYIDPTFFKAKL